MTRGMAGRRLGIGLVGAGGIAREQLAPGLARVPGVDLVSVAARSLATADAAAHALGFRRAVVDWRAIVDDPEVDAVVVATWPDTHAAVTIAALEAGKHVLTCGRMAMDAVEAAAMHAVAQGRPRQVAMLVPGGFALWADPVLRRLLDGRVVGDLRSVRVSWSGGVYGADTWRRLRRFSGNNVMVFGVVHEALGWWLGRTTAVTATLALKEPTMPDPDGRPVPVDVPDLVHALLSFTGGVEALVEMTADPRPEPLACWFHGSAGTLRVDFGRRRLEVGRPGDGPTRWERMAVSPAERGRWQVERDFVAAIRDGAPVRRVDLGTGWHGMAVTDALHESSATGRRVTIAAAPGTTPTEPR